MALTAQNQENASDRSAVLLGPTSLAWFPSLDRLLEQSCLVERTPSRSAFLKRIRSVSPRVIVLYATDEQGTPNEPLLRHCARHCPSSQVVYVHPGPAMKLPSAWSVGPRAVRFVILDGKSRRDDAERIAEQVEDAIGHGSLAPTTPSRA